MDNCVFVNDNNVNIKLIVHPSTHLFTDKLNDEKLFRYINTFLINNNIIKNNIIDLGSFVGDNSIPWAKNITGMVYAIDPSPNNCDFILKMCELNEITNIKTIQSAISNTNELLSTNDNIDHCSFVFGNCGVNGQHKINAVSLDYLYEINVIENIGYIHLDVEGMELKVLQGASNIIDTCRPIISFEQHLLMENYNSVLDYLKSKNYLICLINEHLPNCLPDCRNSIAFPNEIYNPNIIDDIHKYINHENLIIPVSNVTYT